MDDLAGLLKAICDTPADDTVRLAYADRLDERAGVGDAERAEFIRVQIDLYRTPEPEEKSLTPACVECYRQGETCRFHLLCNRSQELLRGPRPDLYEHEPIWFNQENGTSNWVTCFRPVWERGFVAAVACESDLWLRNADAMLARHPVTRVRLATVPEVDTAFSLVGDPECAAFDHERVRETGDRLAPKELLSRKIVVALLHLRWPGVVFEMPGYQTEWDVMMHGLLNQIADGMAMPSIESMMQTGLPQPWTTPAGATIGAPPE